MNRGRKYIFAICRFASVLCTTIATADSNQFLNRTFILNYADTKERGKIFIGPSGRVYNYLSGSFGCTNVGSAGQLGRTIMSSYSCTTNGVKLSIEMTNNTSINDDVLVSKIVSKNGTLTMIETITLYYDGRSCRPLSGERTFPNRDAGLNTIDVKPGLYTIDTKPISCEAVSGKA